MALLAGVPRDVIAQARQYLQRLESNPRTAPDAASPQLSLFESRARILDALGAIDPDALTPREALELLYRLRRMLDQ